MSRISWALVAGLSVGLMFYQRLPNLWLSLVCLLVVGVMMFHHHSSQVALDQLAQQARLAKYSAGLKSATALALLIITISSNRPVIGLIVAGIVAIVMLGPNGTGLSDYLQVMQTPLRFLLVASLAMVIEITSRPVGFASWAIGPIYLSLSQPAQTETIQLVARSIGAISCLSLISLTTPMADLIALLQRLRLPSILIDLMYLIYRFIFILLSRHRQMKAAATSRLGFISYRRSLKTTAMIYQNLFATSYRQALINFDAMESRGYQTKIRFLSLPKPITIGSLGLSMGLVSLVLALHLLLD